MPSKTKIPAKTPEPESGKRQAVDPKFPGSTLNENEINKGSYSAPEPSVPIVKLPLDIGSSSQTEFIVDTGAEISLIKEKALKNPAEINTRETIKLETPFGNGRTIGTCQGNLQINDKKIPCKLQVTKNLPGLSHDGLLGNDFLATNCNVEGPNQKLRFPRMEKNEEECAIPFISAQVPNAIERKTLESRAEPRKGNLFTCSVSKAPENANCINGISKEKGIPPSAEEYRKLEVTFEGPTSIPARAQQVIAIPMRLQEEMLCLSQEVSEGVFLANSLMAPSSKEVMVGVLNVTNSPVVLTSLQLQLAPAKDYSIAPLYQKGEQALNTATLQHITSSSHDNNAINEPNNSRAARLEEELDLSHDLSKYEKASISQLCYEYADIFFLKGDKLPHTKAISHKIPLVQDQAPINQKMYRLPETQRNVINEQLKDMLENEIVQPSKSPWNSPLLVVPKKAGPDGNKRWRVVVDFRKLNDKTIGDAFPLPRIEDILDQLGHSRYFSTLDLASGYHQVLVDPKDRHKTAFSTNYGHYEFKRMPFGLKGAPATFQRLMNYVLTGLQGLECFVYLDDIVIYGKNLEDHNCKLRKVFDRLRENNLKLQPEKCQFLRKEVVYLGHKCSSEGALPDPSKTACVQNFPIPRTVRQVQSFLGLANYYRKFIPNFSKIARPITNLLRKDVKFNWTEKCQEAFQTLKNSLVSPPLLIYPDFSKPFNLTTDASKEAIGAVLSQGKVGEDQPIAYASRTLNKAEQNYSTIERELLAIVWATRNFRCYLQGRKFTVYTDHKPLKGVFNVKDPTSRLVRFHHKLSEFDYNIEYKPGKYNTNADALSRIPQIINETTQGNTCTVKAQVHRSMNSDIETISNATSPKHASCNVVTRAQAQKVQETKPSSEETTEHDHDMEEDGNCLEESEEPKTEPLSSSETPETLTDPNEIETVLKSYHNSQLGGHQGVIRTYKRLKRRYRWKNMLRDIQKFIRKCPKCQKLKASRQYKMPMIITDIAEKPFDKIYLDIVGPLEETASGNKYILTFQDNLTKFADWYAIPNAEANTVAQIFFDEIVTRYRIPKSIVTDQGTNFLSDTFKQLCKLLKVKKLQTSAYHPQSNGALERAHRPLIEYLRTIVDESPNSWDQFLRSAAFVYNNSVHEGTKFTPMDCLFGFTADIPTNLKRDPEPVYNNEKYHYLLRYKLQKTHSAARKNLLDSKRKSKVLYDKTARPLILHIGDKVLLKNESKQHKLSELWVGPYVVTKINSPVNTEIKIGKRTKVIHNNRLKPYFE